MGIRWLLASALSLMTMPTTPVLSAETVDLRLVIAVDVGGSEDVNQVVQRQGYVAAFRAPEVLAAIKSAPYGKIAVTYIEFSSAGFQKVVVPWQVIANREDALALSDELASTPLNHESVSLATSISGAILFGVSGFDQSPFNSDRRTIDISGDGPNNGGLAVTQVRDMAIAEGVTINGLPVLLKPDPISSLNGATIGLDEYYSACVIGGAGSFTLPVEDIGQFETAIERKLVLEIAGVPAQVVPAAADPASQVNC